MKTYKYSRILLGNMMNDKYLLFAKDNFLKIFHTCKYFFKQEPLYSKVCLIGFTLCFIVEGLGLLPRNITFACFILFVLSMGYVSLRLNSNKFVGNVWVFIGVLVYIVYLLFISLFSLNRQISFEWIVFFLMLFFLFWSLQQQWSKIEKLFLYSLLGLGVFFCMYASALKLFPLLFLYVRPHSGYQYVYSLFGSHNHLGDFLVFPLIISFYYYIKEKKQIFLWLFISFIPFFLFSYSRSAYISFIIGFILLFYTFQKQVIKQHVSIVSSTLIISILFFFLTSNALLNSKSQGIAGFLGLSQKSFVEDREGYILQGLKGFLEHRYYGIGPGNFEYISKQFVEIPHAWTSSSHNIFMDVLVETGTVGFVIFVFFVIVLLKTVKKNSTSIYTVLLLSWFAMVQLDYLHLLYSYLLLFPFFLVGLLDSAKPIPRSFAVRHEEGGKLFIFSFCILITFFLIMYAISGVLLYQGNYALSKTIYPLQKEAYKGNFDVRVYTTFFPGEYLGWYKSAKQSEREKKMQEAIILYEKSFWIEPYRDIMLARKIYDLKVNYQSENEAKRFADKLFRQMHNESGEKVLHYEYWLPVNKLCQKVYYLHCPYTLE